MLGPWLARWTRSSLDDTGQKSSCACWKSMHLPIAWLSDCVISRFTRSLCWDFFGSVCAPDKATLKAENHALQCTTAGPVQRYTVYPSWSWLSVWSRVLTWWVFTPWALRLAIELLHVRPRLAKALRKSKRLVGTVALLFSFCLLSGKKNFSHLPWPVAPRTLSILFVAWTVMANLMKFKKKQRVATGLLLDKLHRQASAGALSSRASRVLGPISRYRVADILPHMNLVSRASRPGLIVGFLCILCYGLCTAQYFTLKNMIKPAVLDAQMNLTLSLTLQRVSRVVQNVSIFLGTCYCIATEKYFSTTWSPECSCGAFNMESW